MSSSSLGEGTHRATPRTRCVLLALPLLSAVATVALLEIGLSLFSPIPHSIERNMYFEADPLLGYRLRPNSLGHFQGGIPARSNSQGHRDDEVSIEKPEGVFRILILGDSFTVGANVRQEEAYPQLLEEILKQECSPHIEVVNTAVGGWKPFQYAQYYEHYGRHYEPDLVLVGFFVGNDAHDRVTNEIGLRTAMQGRRISLKAARSSKIGAKVWLTERFNLARLAFLKSPANFSAKRANCHTFPTGYLRIQKKRVEVHLADLDIQKNRSYSSIDQMLRIKELSPAGEQPIIVLLPDENQINRDLQKRVVRRKRAREFDFQMPQRYLREAFDREGLPVIDLLPAFLADERCLYMNDTHWTAEGHALAARVVAGPLRRAIPCAESGATS